MVVSWRNGASPNLRGCGLSCRFSTLVVGKVLLEAMAGKGSHYVVLLLPAAANNAPTISAAVHLRARMTQRVGGSFARTVKQ